MFILWIPKYRDKNLSVNGHVLSVETNHDRDINNDKKYTGRRIKTNSIKNNNIGQGLPELTPVEIVGYEVWKHVIKRM